MNGTWFSSLTILENTSRKKMIFFFPKHFLCLSFFLSFFLFFFFSFPLFLSFPSPIFLFAPIVFFSFSFSQPPSSSLSTSSLSLFLPSASFLHGKRQAEKRNTAHTVMPLQFARRLTSELESTIIQLLESLMEVNPGGHICECVLCGATFSHYRKVCTLHEKGENNLFGGSLWKQTDSLSLPNYRRQYSL